MKILFFGTGSAFPGQESPVFRDCPQDEKREYASFSAVFF